MAPSAPQTVSFAIDGSMVPADVPGLCERVCTLFERSGAEVALCDLSSAHSDAVTIDALARLQLGARRHGCQVRLRDASSELLELLAFMGLGEILQE
jgi:ABC-type transporter Mla MlaB component